MTTPRSLLEAALLKSGRTDRRKLTLETEGLSLANRVLRRLFVVGARVNPTYFAIRSALLPVAGGWRYPADGEALYWLENGSGAEVVVVPRDDTRADITRPAVIFRGRVFLPAGNALDPVPGDALTAEYAKTAAPAEDLDAAVDALWSEAYDELAALEIAASLAVKDGRDDDLAALRGERDEWLQLFVSHLEHAVAIETRRWAQVRAIHTTALVPVSRLLAGGSSVSLGGA